MLLQGMYYLLYICVFLITLLNRRIVDMRIRANLVLFDPVPPQTDL